MLLFLSSFNLSNQSIGLVSLNKLYCIKGILLTHFIFYVNTIPERQPKSYINQI